MEMPVPVEINQEDMAQLRHLEDLKMAITQTIQMVQQQCEAKLDEYNKKSREVWRRIDSKNDVDMQNIVWVPHPTENKIVPAQINLSNQPTK